MKLKQRFQPFLQAIPKLLLFQFVSTVILTLVTWGISLLGSLLLGLSGKAAVTSGDLSFLFTRWQGYVMIILLLAMVTIYVAVELNALIIFCNKTLDGEKVSVWQCIKEGFIGLKKFLSLRGVVVILYAVVLAPIFLAIPSFATTPALVFVGFLMMSSVKDMDWSEDSAAAVGGFLAIIMMPFTYSIANGIMFGILAFVVIRIFQGRVKEVHWVMWVSTALFVLRIITLVV